MNLTERARVILADSGKVVMQNANYGQPPPTAQLREAFGRVPLELQRRYGRAWRYRATFRLCLCDSVARFLDNPPFVIIHPAMGLLIYRRGDALGWLRFRVRSARLGLLCGFITSRFVAWAAWRSDRRHS